jgi:long-chain acyl-CoA synthetase
LPQPENVLLTGATGFVGRELLWRLARTPGQRVVCLIRAPDHASADARLAALLDKAQPDALTADERRRVRPVQADLTVERLGLDPESWTQLATSTHRVVHCGASVDWALPLDSARAVNVEGTRRVIELAVAAHRRGALRRFDYVSTCNVCGRRAGLVGEEDLDDRHGFFNAYERSKFEAERLVRGSGLPFATFRLSTVVGDSRSGYAASFKVLYWPLKILARGLALVVPGDRRGFLDIVPVDYVCSAIETISRDPLQRRKTFHLAAGPQGCSTIGELLDFACHRFAVRPPVMLPPPLFQAIVRPLLHLFVWGKRREVMKKGRVYLPYLAYRAQFDTTQARSALAGRDCVVPPVRDYLEKLIEYAVASEWGRREPHTPVASPPAGQWS